MKKRVKILSGKFEDFIGTVIDSSRGLFRIKLDNYCDPIYYSPSHFEFIEENMYPQFRNVTLNINDVYGTYQPEIPKGWKAIDFRLVKQGDNYLAATNFTLSTGSTPSVNSYLKEPSFGFVRIIVEEDKPKTVQFLVTCENNPINSAFASDRLLYTSRTEVYKVLNIEKKGE